MSYLIDRIQEHYHSISFARVKSKSPYNLPQRIKQVVFLIETIMRHVNANKIVGNQMRDFLKKQETITSDNQEDMHKPYPTNPKLTSNFIREIIPGYSTLSTIHDPEIQNINYPEALRPRILSTMPQLPTPNSLSSLDSKNLLESARLSLFKKRITSTGRLEI